MTAAAVARAKLSCERAVTESTHLNNPTRHSKHDLLHVLYVWVWWGGGGRGGGGRPGRGGGWVGGSRRGVGVRWVGSIPLRIRITG